MSKINYQKSYTLGKKFDEIKDNAEKILKP